MESFGSYETTRELGSGRGTVVFAAQKVGDPTRKFVVKLVFSSAPPDDPFGDTDASRLEAGKDFLDALRLQKAASSSPHIVPVLEAGQDARGAWSVTPFYPRSVDRLISGRVALNREGIYHILRSIVTGLLDLKQATGRSHGRLQGGNVLIGAGATLAQSPIQLTDCAPSRMEARQCELEDLRSIGLLLFQLVCRRAVGTDQDWLMLPLETTVEWTDTFGNSTPAWQVLANTLLDPNLSLDNYSLERLAKDLDALQPKPVVSRGRVLAALAVLALGGGGVAWFLWFNSWVVVNIAIVGPGKSDGPGEAVLLLDGRPASAQPSVGARRQIKLRKDRRYEFAVNYGDLSPFRTNVFLDSRPEQTLELPLEFGALILLGLPPGANFELTNSTQVLKGNSGVNYTNAFAKPGNWHVAVRGKGYLDKDLETDLLAGRTNILSVQLVVEDPDKGVVEFVSSPSGATVVVLDSLGTTNEPIVRTGEGRVQYKPGKYRAIASYPFWDRSQVEVIPFELRAGQHTNVGPFRFATARIRVESEEPTQATLTVSNRFGPGPGLTNFVVSTPADLTMWPTGTFVFHFEAPDFVATNLVVSLREGVNVLPRRPRLATLMGFAEVRTDLPALIWDSRAKDQPLATNLVAGSSVIALRPGEKHTLVVRPLGAEFSQIAEETRDTTPSKGRTNQVPIEFAFGRLALTSDPAANVEIKNPLTDRYVPLTSLAVLPVGNHTLVARYSSNALPEVTTTVAVAKGRTNTLAFEFEYGSVTITSVPSQLEVRLGGNRVGLTPFTDPIVPLGERRYEIWSNNLTKRLAIGKVEKRKAMHTWGRDFTVPEGFTNRFGMEFEFISEVNLYVACFELTEGIYAAVMQSAPRGTNSDLPAVELSAAEARAFIAKLNADAEDARARGANLAEGLAYEYAIPKVSEWRLFAPPSAFAADPESNTRRTGVDAGTRLVHRRGSAPGGALRLFDLYGNVAEMCEGPNGRIEALGGAFNTFVPRASAASIKPLVLDETTPRATAVGLRVVLRKR